MNRHRVLLILLMVFLVGASASAQQVPQQTPPGRGGGGDPANTQQNLELIRVFEAFQAQNTQGAPGRGGRSGGLGNADQLNEAGRVLLAPPVNTTVSNGRGLLVNPNSGAWWTNTALLTRLGLTDDQKLKIERAFENHRQNLTTSRDTLEKEEGQLARLLDAEPLDRSGVTTQIYKVVQARGEMEKVNALMTLEMREVLTRAQWMQLQVQQSVNVSVGIGVTGGGAAGGRGQRSGGPAGGFGGGGAALPTAGGRGARGQ
jgi:Spy/CpxP family protein refolding chaperone